MVEGITMAIEPMVDRAGIEAAIDQAKEALSHGELRGLSWPMVRGGIADAMAAELSAGVFSWMARCWSAARELRALRDTGKPDKTSLFKLGEHKLEGKLHPVVRVEVAGHEAMSFRFDVPLTLKVNAVTLDVREAQIIAMGGGECSGSLKIEYDGCDLSGPLKIASYRFPGRHEFKEPGIAIP